MACGTGLLIAPLHLLTRTVIVTDKNGVVRYMQIVPEITELPDMEAAMAAAKAFALKSSTSAAAPLASSTITGLNVADLAEVEITSEAAAHPIESALEAGDASGWRAAAPGKKTMRLVFMRPQQLRRIQLTFIEPHTERTQEYMLRWSSDEGNRFST